MKNTSNLIFFNGVVAVLTTASIWFGATSVAAFDGTLNGVSITDASGNNQPPTAEFSYSESDGTFSFDAGLSNDQDGQITLYSWDFGDGNTAEGVNVSHTFMPDASMSVTLTVVDDAGGVTLIQKKVAGSVVTDGIFDDFSTDTSANYAILQGKALQVYDGTLHTGSWSTTMAYHETSIESSDHTVEADIVYQPEYGGGLIFRFDPTAKTGYVAYFESGRLLIKKFQNDSQSFLTMHIGNYTAGTYKVSVTISGSSISASVNGQQVITATDNTYGYGPFAGVRVRAGSAPDQIWVDNFSAKK